MSESQPMRRWRADFYAGLVLLLPAVISLAIVKWLFGTVANVTDFLLFFLDWLPLNKKWIYVDGVSGRMFLPWSLLALVLAIALITLIGRYARHYLGQKAIELVDRAMLRVPLLNKIYGAIKQVNEAFSTSKKSSFKQVALIEFPGPGVYSLAFVTGDQQGEVASQLGERIVSLFVPTTPNPTSGFLVMVPASKVTVLEMSVADGIKFIVSLGTVAPEQRAHATAALAPQRA